MREIAGDEIRRRTNELNGVFFSFDGFIHRDLADGMAGGVEMIGSAGSVPKRVLMTDVEDVIFDEILELFGADPGIVAQIKNGERHVEKMSFIGILGDEMAVEKSFFEVKLTGVGTFRIIILGQEHICKGVIRFMGINKYLKALVHFLVIFKKYICIMIDLCVIHSGP